MSLEYEPDWEPLHISVKWGVALRWTRRLPLPGTRRDSVLVWLVWRGWYVAVFCLVEVCMCLCGGRFLTRKFREKVEEALRDAGIPFTTEVRFREMREPVKRV